MTFNSRLENNELKSFTLDSAFTAIYFIQVFQPSRRSSLLFRAIKLKVNQMRVYGTPKRKKTQLDLSRISCDYETHLQHALFSKCCPGQKNGDDQNI